MFRYLSKFIKQNVEQAIDFLSFDSEVRRLVDILNRKIEEKEEISLLESYPAGFKREISKRRIRIALAYINIVQQLESEKHEERLQALEILIRESLHAKNIDMPLNTARLQAALMKEVVKSKGDLRRQLEYMTDFTRASYGQPNVIRELLKLRMLIEVPEGGKKLSEMELGWDGHVHDNLSEGRKTPSQVLLDAFIKGISEVTLAYYDFADPRIIREALRAGEILGIRVRIGIEFSVGPSTHREHFMYLLPQFSGVEELIGIFSREEISIFMKGLHENSFRREETIKRMLRSFNETKLTDLNHETSNIDCLLLKPLKWEDLKKIVLEGQASRMHLGELLYRSFKEVLHKRLLTYKAQYETLQEEVHQKRKSRTDLNAIEKLYKRTRLYYENISPENLRLTYFEDRKTFDYDSSFLSKEELFPLLIKANGEIIYIHPLSIGVQHAITTIIKYHSYITQVETFNMHDSIYRNPSEYHTMNNFVNLIKNGSLEEVKVFLESIHLNNIDEKELQTAWKYYHAHPIQTRCGSDSTGRDPKIPGMGFIRLSSIPEPSSRKFFLETHMELPFDIDLSLGMKSPVKDDSTFSVKIISLGTTTKFRKNLVGDEEDILEIDILSFWRYLNPTLKNLMKGAIAFIPACYFLPLPYPLIWFGITFIRNAIADMTSSSGFNPREWKFADINFENATNSVFWTGFSIPLLKTADWVFEIGVAEANITNDAILRWGKFFFLSFVNGAYLYTHNTLRDFSDTVRKMNFFRSILSFPVASLFSYILDLAGIGFIPKIVQTKFWSDVVAGVIEGSGKFKLIEKLRQRDFLELLPLVDYSLDQNKRVAAMIDIMYIWAKGQRGKSTLEGILLNDKKLLDKFFYVYTRQRTIEEMMETLLSYYNDDEAVALTRFVGIYYSRFCTWLIQLRGEAKNTTIKLRKLTSILREEKLQN